MLLLGHLGIGKTLAGPFAKKLDRKWVYLGTVLPDLIDKPLYYSLYWIYGKQAQDLGLISGSRTFGHTALLSVILATAALAKKSKLLAALALGIATHLLLDSVSDIWRSTAVSSVGSPLMWPLTGLRMPVSPFKDLADHLNSKIDPVYLCFELVGALLLLQDFYRRPWFGPLRSKSLNLPISTRPQ